MEVQEPDQLPSSEPVENKQESTTTTETPTEKEIERETSEPKLDTALIEQHAEEIASAITGEEVQQRDASVENTQEVPPIAQEGELCCGYTEAQIDVYIDAVFNKFECPPESMRNPVVQLLNRRRVSALVVGDYDKAELQDKIMKMYNYVVHREEEKANEDHRIDVLYERWQNLQNDQQKINAAWDKKVEGYAQEDQTRWDEMIARHEEELRVFNESWKDPKKLRTFAKPSAKLLQMREREKNMAVSRMYQQAKDMKAVADALQKKETEAAQQKINQQMALEKRAMEERHEKEKSKHMNHRETVLNVMEKQRQNELKPVQTAMAQIRAKKGLVSNPKSATMTTRSVSNIETVSPRTQQLYATFKSEKKTSKLDVKPGEEPKSKTMRRSQTGTMKAASRPETPHEEEAVASAKSSARSAAKQASPRPEEEQLEQPAQQVPEPEPEPEQPVQSEPEQPQKEEEEKGEKPKEEEEKVEIVKEQEEEKPKEEEEEEKKEEEKPAKLDQILGSVLLGK